MFTFSSEVVIERSAEEVVRLLTDFERYTEWTDMTDSRKVGDEPFGVGSRTVGTMGAGPLTFHVTWEITDYDPSGGYAYRTVSDGSLAMDGAYRVAALGPASTRVTADGEVRTHGLLRLLEPILRGEVRRNEAGELQRLKALLETGASAAGEEVELAHR